MAVAIEHFSKELVEHGVLSEEDLQAWLDAIPAAERPATGEQLARRLVKEKRISAYQAQVVYSGQGKSLKLGKYFVLDKLGQGGMGLVLKAEHRMMKRLVAIKVLSPTVTRTQELRQRFQREVEAAARLTHPNIVGAFDAGEANGSPFLVMEYVRGDDLASIVKTKGPLSVDQAIDCIVQAARGLEYAHDQGVVHRDIKPANLLLDTEGTVKILDMGLARIDAVDVAAQADLTGTGTVMGTVDYMAPEQAVSTKHADARSDLYSLGISLWYLLIGKSAYDGDSMMARLLAHRDQPIPNLCAARGDVPEALQMVFRRLVAKQPADRYPSAKELIADLEACRTGGSLKAVSVAEVATGADEFQRFLQQMEAPTEPPRGGRARPVRAGMATEVRSPVSRSLSEETLLPSRVSDTQTVRRQRGASAPRRPWSLDRRAWIGGAGALMLLLAVVILFSTPQGTLRIEILDPEVELTVQGTNLTFHGPDLEPVSLKTGEQKLLVTRGDLSFETEKFEVKRGKETRIRVERTGDRVVVQGEGKVLGERGIPRPEPARRTADKGPGRRADRPEEATNTGAGSDPDEGAGWVDLLAKIELPGDVVKHEYFGDFAWEGKVLISPGGNKAGRIDVRYPLPAEYEVLSVVERMVGHDGVVFYLPVSDRRASCEFDTYPSVISGISQIDGKWADDNETTFRERVLSDMQRHTIRIRVGPGRVLAKVDDREVIRWEGDPSRLAFGIPGRNLQFGAAYHQFKFHSLKVRSLEPQTSDASGDNAGDVALSHPPVPRGAADRPAEAPAPATAPFTAKQAAAFQEAWAAYLGLPVEFTNSLGMRFRLIPPGEFQMGCDVEVMEALREKVPTSEEFRRRFGENHAACVPRHTVRITRPFYMQMHEVTVGQYQKLLGQIPELNDPAAPGLPVMRNVSLRDAVAFCDALSRREERTLAHRTVEGRPARVLEANGYRLPTEAEWEYACRGGTTGFYFLDDDVATLARLEILREYESFHAGNRAKPNPFGLFDQYGGSTEWCFDRFRPYEAGTVTDPFVEPGDGMGVVRGGSEYASGGLDPAQVNSVVRFPAAVVEPVNQYFGFGRLVLPIEL